MLGSPYGCLSQKRLDFDMEFQLAAVLPRKIPSGGESYFCLHVLSSKK